MKKTLLLLAAVAFSFSSTFAQEEGTEKILTTNHSLTITTNVVACSSTNQETQVRTSKKNHYFKKFNLTDLGVSDTFHAQSFVFASAVLENVSEVSVIVELWKTKLDNFPETWGSADYENVLTAAVGVSEAPAGVTLEFDEPISFEPDDVIIAQIWYDELEEGQLFYVGANTDADEEISYLMSSDCNIDTPTPFTEVNKEFNMNLVMAISGVEGFLGVQDFVDADLTLYPNPASEQFNIASGNETIQTVIVRDILGKTIQTIQVNGLTQNVNVSNLPKGLYLVEVELETGRAVQKLIKK